MQEFIQKYKAKSGKFKDLVVVTVCTLLDENGRAGRGVAICSPSDSPFEKSGEWTAKCYAERAIKGRSDNAITDERAIQTLLRTDCPFVMQSEKNPRLTFQEVAFFYGKKHVQNYLQEKYNKWTFSLAGIDANVGYIAPVRLGQ